VKRSDWALVILIVLIVGVVGYFTVNALVPPPNQTPQTVPTATPISSNLTKPDPLIFNTNAINPTVPVTIGGSANPNDTFTLGQGSGGGS